MTEDLIRAIKIGNKLSMVIVFEGGLLIRIHVEEHLIPFFKLAFGMMPIIFLLHPILGHYQINLESVENVGSRCEGFSTSCTLDTLGNCIVLREYFGHR
jgi:hypothetical protein